MDAKKIQPELTEERVEQAELTPVLAGGKKPFVEPALSVPVDILKATAFFQTADTTVDTSDV